MTTIWITGGKGFIGRHLARLVAGYGNQVYGIGHGSWPAEEAGRWGYTTWFVGEIDADNLKRMSQVSGAPNIVYHLAGGASVGASFQDPRDDFCRSVESSSRLLEWLRLNAPNAQLVTASSAAVYGAAHAGLILEDVAIAPYSPYGTHKAMMESLCRSYAENFGLRIAIVRLFSVYGAGLEKQLIWDLCSKLAVAGGRPVLLGGTGGELRDWLHISDAVNLLWMARAQCNKNCPVLNGGAGVATSIREVANLVCEAWGGEANVEFSGIARAGDPPSLVADCGRENQMGFIPSVKLAEGILDAVRWFKARE